jgi:ketosteroid isomerase-like protein
LCLLAVVGAAGLAGAGALAAVAAPLPLAASPAPAPAAVAPAGRPAASGAAPAASSTGVGAVADHRQENKALVRRYLTEVLAAGRLDKLDQVVAANFVDRSPGASTARGPAVVRQIRQNLGALFAKLEYTPQEVVAEDDRVAAHYLVVATPRPEPGRSTPRPLVVDGLALFRVRDGRIQEVFVLNDRITLLRELGFTLMPPRPAGAQTAAPATPGSPAAPAKPPPAAPPGARTGAAPPPGTP